MSSLGLVLLGALAVIVGALIPIQAATNAAMSRAIGSIAITSLALFAIGFVVVAAWAIVIREPLPSLETLRHVPAYGYFGGFIVASYVISITFLAPRLGVGNAIRLVVTGQIVARSPSIIGISGSCPFRNPRETCGHVPRTTLEIERG